MIVSEQWLRDWVSLDLNSQQISECLTSAGLEIESIQPLPGSVESLVVGQVVSVEKHPDADKLKLTQVDVGDSLLDIVCGAANVAENMRVAVAKVGAKLPNGMEIKSAKVRGVISNGMLCSAQELGLSESSDGILALDDDAEIGQRVDEYLVLDDALIDIDLTPNRGDCLSIQGIARELKVLASAELHPLDISDVEAEHDEVVDIDLQEADGCPIYCARVIKGIDPSTQSPIWMQERLRRCGVKPISPAVDVTNYVMLELGQPMHAFDRAKLNEKIVVRKSKQGEKIRLLDESVAELDNETLVIADASGPIAIAGVMGGSESAIDESSQDVVLEAAHFSKKLSAGRARQYGLHTESSHRFERGVDPNLPEIAMQRATELLVQICGGVAGPICRKSSDRSLPEAPSVSIRFQRLQQLLGMQLDRREVEGILSRVSDQTTSTEEGWLVEPPSYRFDIECEADLVEEVARVKGYDSIPTALPRISPTAMVASEARTSLSRVRSTLAARDFNEVISYSFISPEEHSIVSEEVPIRLSNPLADNLSVMRTSLLPGLLKSLAYNKNRQQQRVRLFEVGASYHKSEHSTLVEGFAERPRLAAVISGPRHPMQWSKKGTEGVDFYDLKSDLEAVLNLTGKKEPFIFTESNHVALHPGQVASVSSLNDLGAEQQIGFIGRLHPSLEKQFGFNSPVYAFELDVDKAFTAELPEFSSLSKFPSVKRDLSFIFAESVLASSITKAISMAVGDALEDIRLFDVYQGEGVASGHKSISLSMVLRHPERTMTDAEVEELTSKAIKTVETKFAAELRS